MSIHKEGYASITIVVIFCSVLNLGSHYLTNVAIIHYLGYALSAFLLIAILQFFRSPKRNIRIDPNSIISPADGKVVVIEEVQEDEYFKGPRKQVSVFMSPINVHLNRYPMSGTVKYVKYHAGKYLVAWHPKSSAENERTTIVTENEKGQSVLFRQIAGAMARRIVYYCKEGETIEQGAECGFIKFGSRVDLLLPVDVKVNVKIGDVVKGGESIIATFS